MATILAFDPSGSRRATRSGQAGKTVEGPAQILIFTGVRREQLAADEATEGSTRRPEPMFDDPLPSKPRGRKNGRRKKA
ncbi:hypothetical protein [Hoeflea phototrophica]|jgi:hypothetical protein|uniref:hypothetical protein n=1 Tax=Hoeflea phototrophica TaxID=244596 RepID=UPI0012EB76C8|nr:hypothetical protein [Hoeflea phototrophica]